jgi:CRISPR-associated protein Csb2
MRPLALTPGDPGPAFALRPERWAGPARSFATATPVILDRFPRRGRSVEDELRQSIVTAGFPSPASVEVLAGPAVRGGVLVGDLSGDLPPGKRVHASVAFAEPVRGPLVAGRGRFRGVGLFAVRHGAS